VSQINDELERPIRLLRGYEPHIQTTLHQRVDPEDSLNGGSERPERVTVPKTIAEDEITAAYRNGVLEVHLPLAEPAERDDERTIDISDRRIFR